MLLLESSIVVGYNVVKKKDNKVKYIYFTLLRKEYRRNKEEIK